MAQMTHLLGRLSDSPKFRGQGLHFTSVSSWKVSGLRKNQFGVMAEAVIHKASHGAASLAPGNSRSNVWPPVQS